LQDEFDKNKQPREQQLFGGEFSPLSKIKIKKSSAPHKKDFFRKICTKVTISEIAIFGQ
jgi:hypothetical protein